MGLWNKLAGIAGGIGGAFLGGPAGAMAGYQLGNAVTGGGGDGGPAPQRSTAPPHGYDELLEQERTGAGAQDAITRYTQAAIQSAMPSFQHELQLTREDGIRRGISTGDLGTSNEGDLASAFQRNVVNSVAGQATQLYDSGRNRYADLLTGKMDRDTAEDNYRRQRKTSLAGAIGTAAGAYFGGRNGGGAQGASTGASIGGAIGRGVGSY